MNEAAPSFDKGSNTVTIPSIEGIEYKIKGQHVDGEIVIDQDTTVTVSAARGYVLRKGTPRSHTFRFNASGEVASQSQGETVTVDTPADPIEDQTAGNTEETSLRSSFRNSAP